MPYSYPKNIPNVAKNWTAAEQRKCVEAANAVLREGGKEAERNAIFACIRAAGRTEHPGGQKMTITNQIAEAFEELVHFLKGKGDTEEATAELGEKAVWATAYINDLSDSSFLYIEAGGEKDEGGKTVPRSKRHFPYKGSDGAVDLPHLRNAIARIPQSNAPGLSAEKKTALQERARGMLLQAQGKKEISLDQQLQQVRDAWSKAHPIPAGGGAPGKDDGGWVKEIYSDHVIVDRAGGFYTVPYARDAEGSIEFGEEQKVVVMYVPSKSLRILKQADGAYRWIGWVSNHFRDNDTPREIFSTKAHQEYIAWADKNKKYPELRLWHVPGAKVGQTDWLDYADGFLLASGLFDKDKEGVAERLAESKELAMSHGFIRLKHDPKAVVTDGYRMLECSIVPVGAEANPWTKFAVKEETMISEQKKAFLVKFLPEDAIEGIERDTEALRKAAEAAGVDWKELEAEGATGEEPPKAEETPPESTGGGEPVNLDALADALANRLMERFGLKDLSDVVAGLQAGAARVEPLAAQVKVLEDEVKELRKSDDEKVAAIVTPKATQLLSWAGKAASKNAETVLKEGKPEDEALKSASARPFLLEIAEQAVQRMAERR